MITLDHVDDLRAACEGARRDGRSVALVPTMGFLHAGHRSLLRAARAANHFVVLTIFVNPRQFGPNEDLDGYPRDLAGDAAVAETEGVDVVFAPPVAAVYPEPTRTTVHVEGLTDGLCGAARPTHFDGVTTVVAKLCSMVGPCTAYFGRKDFQQLAVVRRMVRDLDLPVDVVGCPIVREPDGLARSSRNAYLADEERSAAGALPKALFWASETVVRGERSAVAVTEAVRAVVATEPTVQLEYVEVRRADDLAPIDVLEGAIVVAVAARIGRARIIDNVTMTVRGRDVSVDLGVVAFDGDEPRSWVS